MRYLSKQNFINFNGLAFEELICEVIREMYGEDFTHTTLTNDGGKDFVITNKGSKIWAECKEYTNKLSFNDVSTTLLMAHIKKINKLIIFSFSSVNRNFYKKLADYAESTSIDVEVYADEQLEELLLKYRKKTWFSDYINLNNLEHIESYYTTNDIVSYKTYMSYGNTNISYYKKHSININDIFSIELLIINKDNMDKTFTIWYSDFDAQAFECINKDYESAYTFVVPAHSAKIDKLSVRIKSYTKNYKMPIIIVDNIRLKCKGKIVSTWIAETKIIGDNAKFALNVCNTSMIKSRQLKFCLILGGSGCGKTKILKEVKINALKSNSKTFYLDADNKHVSLSFFCKELLSYCSGLPLFINTKGRSKIINNSNSNKFYDKITSVLYNSSYNFEENLEILSEIIFYYLKDNSFVIILENIQKYDSKIIELFEKIDLLSVTNHSYSTIIYSVNTEQVHKGTDIEAFISNFYYLKNHNPDKYFCAILKDFSPKDANEYIKCSLNIDKWNHSFDNSIEKILNITGLNPLSIQNYLIELRSQKATPLINSNIERDIKKFNIQYRNFSSIDNRMLLKYSKKEQIVYVSVLGILGITPYISYKWMHYLCKEYENIIQDLKDNAIIVYDSEKNEYRFRHSKLKQYYRKYIDQIDDYVLKYINLLPYESNVEIIFILKNLFDTIAFNDFDKICQYINMYSISYENKQLVYNFFLDLCTNEIFITKKLSTTLKKICLDITYTYGLKVSLSYFKKSLDIILKYINKYKFIYEDVLFIINEYCYNLMNTEDYEMVSIVINKIKSNNVTFENINDDNNFNFSILKLEILLGYKNNETKNVIYAIDAIENFAYLTELQKSELYILIGNTYYYNYKLNDEYKKQIITNWNKAYDCIGDDECWIIDHDYEYNAKTLNVLYRKVLADIISEKIPNKKIIRFLENIIDKTNMPYFEIKIRHTLSVYTLLYENNENATEKVLKYLEKCLDILYSGYKNIKLYSTTIFYMAEIYMRNKKYDDMYNYFLCYLGYYINSNFIGKEFNENLLEILVSLISKHKYDITEHIDLNILNGLHSTNTYNKLIKILKEDNFKLLGRRTFFYDAENDINYPHI